MDFIFYVTLFCFILILSITFNNIDFDFWARLIVGKTFFQTGSLLNNDFYSYGTTHDFVDHEWGSSLIFYLIQHHFSDIGITLFKCFIIFLTLFTITKIIKLQKNDIRLHFLFFFFILHTLGANIFSTIRCQIFSFLFFVVFLYILEFTKKKNIYRVLICLPALMIIWANMHGGFVIGLAIIGIYALGEYLNKNKKYILYLYSLLFSFISAFINPYGIKYIKYIFEALTLDRKYIPEWSGIFTINAFNITLIKFYIFFAFTIILILFCLFKQIKKNGIKNTFQAIDKTKLLLILFTLLITIKSLRCYVFFGYTILSFCYVDFYNIFNKKLPKQIDKLKEIILLILIMISAFSHIATKPLLNTLNQKNYPIQCVEFIKENNLRGNIFTIFHTGSYVIYKLYPNNFVFMDGRYEEVYDTSLINKMAKFHLNKDNKKLINEFHTDVYIIDKSYPVYNVLKEDKDLFLAYEENNYALFLDKKYKKHKFKFPTKDNNYYNMTKFDTNIDFN